jgi:hypothetical protein
MNIQTVAENLRKTLAGKEHLLEQYSRALDGDKMLYEQKIAVGAASEFVKINIAELKRILEDVKQCVKQAADHSWMINPDRMGGGGYSADELDPNRGWK